MARPASKHPTELELAILNVLWRGGGSKPMTGREIQEGLAGAGRELAYTSVVTVLNIMTRKGYLRRKKAAAGAGVGGGAAGFAYQPSVTEKANAGRMLRDLIDRVFHGSSSAVLLKLLEESRLDAGEIARLRDVVDRKAAESASSSSPAADTSHSERSKREDRP
jgi:predicted transcriptional regulator